MMQFPRVMTMHKIKGLTSKVVIVAGCCDGLIPYKDDRLVDGERVAKMREYRRLFHVAVALVNSGDPIT